MSESLTTTIPDLHAAIVAAMQNAFGSAIRQYGAYTPIDLFGDATDPELRTPALLLALESLDEADEPARKQTSGRAAVRCTWVIHVLLSIKSPSLQIALPDLAAAVMALIRRCDASAPYTSKRGNRWGKGLACDYPDAAHAQPSEFAPTLHGCDAWSVRWEQVVYLPESPA